MGTSVLNSKSPGCSRGRGCCFYHGAPLRGHFSKIVTGGALRAFCRANDRETGKTRHPTANHSVFRDFLEALF
jgi:hypothetical protein